jgi:hypothetical protein
MGLSVLALKGMLFVLVRVKIRASLAVTTTLLHAPVRCH